MNPSNYIQQDNNLEDIMVERRASIRNIAVLIIDQVHCCCGTHSGQPEARNAHGENLSGLKPLLQGTHFLNYVIADSHTILSFPDKTGIKDIATTEPAVA